MLQHWPITQRNYLSIDNVLFPHRTENGKIFSSQGIFNRLDKLGNFNQNTGKMREFDSKYWKNEGILAKFFSGFLIEVCLLCRFLYLLKSLNKTLENKKNTGLVREISQSKNVGTMYFLAAAFSSYIRPAALKACYFFFTF